ncbi:unknown protein [Seminavis robusta]|uniref:Uncharacterized protein n=1 Tax=Seminavis robusta TaxID=568900 RepID=A0A9N8EMT7_9STRA|nr:unknown protein [Seminavis robusta]|eukprot:Sro1387_g268350.1 n/a (179) ;mRNA; f:11590-12217
MRSHRLHQSIHHTFGSLFSQPTIYNRTSAENFTRLLFLIAPWRSLLALGLDSKSLERKRWRLCHSRTSIALSIAILGGDGEVLDTDHERFDSQAEYEEGLIRFQVQGNFTSDEDAARARTAARREIIQVFEEEMEEEMREIWERDFFPRSEFPRAPQEVLDQCNKRSKTLARPLRSLW